MPGTPPQGEAASSGGPPGEIEEIAELQHVEEARLERLYAEHRAERGLDDEVPGAGGAPSLRGRQRRPAAILARALAAAPRRQCARAHSDDRIADTTAGHYPSRADRRRYDLRGQPQVMAKAPIL